ncbi:hypothetical protein TIFTF001_022983 [Ficus carica]|uniref:Uncharacterized protein n=1 Tax=Ficus carica TaxID=3494 RepID=A0AA88DDA3_FICCA|nr:hypothetical protein TIFTF001_022983 [Ficus carica]
MVLDRWALSRQLCRRIMVDMVEVMVMEVIIGTAEIINGKETEMMITIMSPLRDMRTMNRGRTLIMTQDRKRIQGFGRVVTLMMKRKMNESDDLSKIDFELANKL